MMTARTTDPSCKKKKKKKQPVSIPVVFSSKSAVGAAVFIDYNFTVWSIVWKINSLWEMKCYWHELIRSTTLLSCWLVIKFSLLLSKLIPLLVPPVWFFFFVLFFPLFSSSSGQFSSSGISCNWPFQMVIDRECWGFVVALITNMESTALGSFLYFLNSLRPLTFYCTLRPFCLCLVYTVLHNSLLFVCLFWFFYVYFLLCLSNALTSMLLSAEQVEDRRLRKKEGAMKSVFCVGLLIINRLTHQTREEEERNESAPRHTPSKRCGELNQRHRKQHPEREIDTPFPWFLSPSHPPLPFVYFSCENDIEAAILSAILATQHGPMAPSTQWPWRAKKTVNHLKKASHPLSQATWTHPHSL